MEDPGVVILEGLPVWDHPVEQRLVQGEGCDGGQQPAITWERAMFRFKGSERKATSIGRKTSLNAFGVKELIVLLQGSF